MANACNEGEINAIRNDSELEISSKDADDSEIDEGTRKVIKQLVMKSRGKKAKTTCNGKGVVKKKKSTDEKKHMRLLFILAYFGLFLALNLPNRGLPPFYAAIYNIQCCSVKC